ncbi:MAG TPA: hypothetical protein VNG51_19475 [Ktedonobacteraceae bacterium]|nr:hypothetical protein [Ktedonobacteraceae bacterium]
MPDPATKEVDGKQVPIPQEEQGWVKMDVSPMNVQDSLVIEASDTTLMRAGTRIVAERIKEWNFTDAAGNVAPVNFQTVLQLGKTNIDYLSGQIAIPESQVLSDYQKKS